MTIHYPLVRVLIATHNGERFLQEQIESILEQKNVRVQIDVLDDGSTDGTYKLLQDLFSLRKIHTLRQSNNLGASEAFRILLADAHEADFYAFSDQDDVWESTKLCSQLELMTVDTPTLVICGRKLIGEDGQVISDQIHSYSPSFNNAMVQNIAYGNTQVLNPTLREILLSRPCSTKFFDSWVYLVSAAFGEVKRVNANMIKYRIHEKNAVGLGKKNLSHFRQLVFDSRELCLNFSKTFSDYDLVKQDNLEQYLKVFNSKQLGERIYYSLCSNIRRQSKIETILWKLYSPFISNKRFS